MTDPGPVPPEPAQAVAADNSQQDPPASSRQLNESELREKLLLSIPEAASLLRVGARTVWRLMADPKSGFPKPRRLRGRTLLVRDELLAFLDVEVPG